MQAKSQTPSEINEATMYGKKNIVLNLQTVSGEMYEHLAQALEKTKGSLTTTYGNDIEGQYQKLNQKVIMSTVQNEVLSDLVSQLLEGEKTRKDSFNVRVGEATDKEIVLSRKTQDGLYLISINNFGDIMLNFSG